MTQSKPTISTWQLFSVLILTRLLSVLNFAQLFYKGMNTSDYFVSILITVLMVLICSVPLYYQYKKYKNKSIIDISNETSKVLAKVVSVLYALLFIFYVYTSSSTLSLFTETITFPATNTTAFIVLLIALACYGATLGLESISRAGSISFVMLCVSFAVIFITMINKIDMNNFSPLLYDGIKPAFTEGIDTLARTVEIPIMAVILSRTTGNKLKGYVGWIVGMSLIFFSIFFVVIGGAGEFAFTQLFPVHTVAVLSEFTLLERLDVLLTGVWVLSALIKMSFLLFLQADILSDAFGKKYSKLFVVGAGIIVLISQLLFSRSTMLYAKISSTMVVTIIFVAFALIIPISVLVINKVTLMKRIKK